MFYLIGKVDISSKLYSHFGGTNKELEKEKDLTLDCVQLTLRRGCTQIQYCK